MKDHLLRASLLLVALPLAAQAPALGAPTRAGTPFRVHDSPVMALDWANDGSLLVTASLVGDVRVWDAATGRQVAAAKFAGRPNGAAFCGAKNEHVAIAGSEGGVQLFAARTGKPGATFADCNGVGASPDQTRLAAITNAGALVLIDVATGQRTATIEVGGKLQAPCFSPDGTLVLVDEFLSGNAHVLDVAQGKVIGRIAHGSRKGERSFSADGKSLFALAGAKVKQVAVPDGAAIAELRVELGSSSLAIRDNGAQLLVADMDGGVVQIDVAADKAVRTFRGHTGLVGRLGVSPDGKTLASGAWDGVVRLWDLDTGAERCPAADHAGRVTGIAFSADGKSMITGDGGGALLSWGRDGKGRNRLAAGAFVIDVEPTADGSWWVACGDGVLRRCTAAGEVAATVKLEGDGLIGLDLAVIDGGKALLVGCTDGSVRRIDTAATGAAAAKSWTGQHEAVAALVADANGEFVVSLGADGAIVIWDAAKGEAKHRLPAQEKGAEALAHAGGGVVIAAAPDGVLVRIDAAGKETHRAVAKSAEPVIRFDALLAIPSRGLVVAACLSTLHWFDATDLRALGTTEAPGSVTDLAATADGSAFAAGLQDGTIAVWTLPAAKPAAKPPAKPAKQPGGKR